MRCWLQKRNKRSPLLLHASIYTSLYVTAVDMYIQLLTLCICSFTRPSSHLAPGSPPLFPLLPLDIVKSRTVERKRVQCQLLSNQKLATPLIPPSDFRPSSTPPTGAPATKMAMTAATCVGEFRQILFPHLERECYTMSILLHIAVLCSSKELQALGRAGGRSERRRGRYHQLGAAG